MVGGLPRKGGATYVCVCHHWLLLRSHSIACQSGVASFLRACAQRRRNSPSVKLVRADAFGLSVVMPMMVLLSWLHAYGTMMGCPAVMTTLTSSSTPQQRGYF